MSNFKSDEKLTPPSMIYAVAVAFCNNTNLNYSFMLTAALIKTNQPTLPGLFASMQHLHSSSLVASEWRANSTDPAHTVTGKVISHHHSIQAKDFSNRKPPKFHTRDHTRKW